MDRRGAVGQSETLRTDSVYRYVRNPMYGGISFTIVGLGFVFDSGGIVLAGIFWLALAIWQCKREEKELKERFGSEYTAYANATPMIFPKIKQIIRNRF